MNARLLWPAPLDEIRSRLERFLAARLSGGFAIVDLQPLTGGASKQHFVFELDEGGPKRRSLVLRTALPASLGTAPNLEREFEIQRAIRGVVPVAEVVCVDARGEVIGAPALVLERMGGTTIPPEAAGKPSGFGSLFSADRRRKLAPAFLENMARIHAFADSPQAAEIAALERPQPRTREATEWPVAWWRRTWEDDALEDHPMIEVAFDWCEENAPVTETISFLHGDYRAGNFLFDPATNEVTAVLDWEMSRFGDRHEDLGWTLARIYTAVDGDGTELACGLAPREELVREYERRSGLAVDRERLFYY